jgi:hypothetical protein
LTQGTAFSGGKAGFGAEFCGGDTLLTVIEVASGEIDFGNDPFPNGKVSLGGALVTDRDVKITASAPVVDLWPRCSVPRQQ